MRESIARHLPDLHAAGARRRMSLPLGLPHPSRRSSEQAEEIREARRFLLERVRGDWEYPPLPRFQIPLRSKDEGEDGGDDEVGADVADARDDEEDDDGDENEGEVGEDDEKVAGFRYYKPSNHEREQLLHRAPEQLNFEPAGWREREYSSGETTDEDAVAGKAGNEGKTSEFKYDNPDSIGEQASDRKLARKRKRQKLLDEECTWNDGLAHWLARRDVWCGAHTSTQVYSLESRREEERASTSGTASPSVHSSTDSSETDAASTTPSTAPEGPLDTAGEPSVIPTEPPAPPSEILVPLVPPILPNHPIRRRINANVYPEIYSKIILQSRTPSVPINLLTMTRALVQGWKDNGDWPPKPLEVTWGEKKYASPEAALRSGVKAVGRALRLTGGESSIVAKS